MDRRSHDCFSPSKIRSTKARRLGLGASFIHPGNIPFQAGDNSLGPCSGHRPEKSLLIVSHAESRNFFFNPP